MEFTKNSEDTVGRAYSLAKSVIMEPMDSAIKFGDVGDIVTIVEEEDTKDKNEPEAVNIMNSFGQKLVVSNDEIDFSRVFLFKCIFCPRESKPVFERKQHFMEHLVNDHIFDKVEPEDNNILNINKSILVNLYSSGKLADLFVLTFLSKFQMDKTNFRCLFCNQTFTTEGHRKPEKTKVMHILHVHLKDLALKYFKKSSLSCPLQPCDFRSNNIMDMAKHIWLDSFLEERQQWVQHDQSSFVAGLLALCLTKNRRGLRRKRPDSDEPEPEVAIPLKAIKTEPPEVDQKIYLELQRLKEDLELAYRHNEEVEACQLRSYERIRSLEAELKTSNKEKAGLESKVQGLQEDKAAMDSKIKEYKSQFQDHQIVQQELDYYKGQKQRLEKDHESMIKFKESKHQKEVDRLQEIIGDLKKQLANQIRIAQEEVRSRKNQSLKPEVNDDDDIVVIGERSNSNDLIDLLNSRLHEKTQEIKKLRNQVRELQSQVTRVDRSCFVIDVTGEEVVVKNEIKKEK